MVENGQLNWEMAIIDVSSKFKLDAGLETVDVIGKGANIGPTKGLHFRLNMADEENTR